jgi:ribonucleotide reductase alpha subunit
MRAVETNSQWALKSPKDAIIQSTVSARNLWIRLLTARIETGEPYIIYVDTVNRLIPQHHKLAGLDVKTSNLCSEITLPTGIDKDGNDRTAVCCLSSLNLETYDELAEKKLFEADIFSFALYGIKLKLSREPRLIVDISNQFTTKLKAIKAFKSQHTIPLWWLWLKWMVYYKAIISGLKIRTRFAEEFYKIR